MKKLLPLSAIALALLCHHSANAADFNLGCQNVIVSDRISQATVDSLLYLPEGASFNDLVAIAFPNCTLAQTFGRPGIPDHSVFAYALADEPQCYIRAELRWSTVISIRKVCLGSSR